MAAMLIMPSPNEATVKVVTTQEPTPPSPVRSAGNGSRPRPSSPGNADAHFVKPKPSYAFMLRDADLFVSTGLDLELWAPVLVNKIGNRKIVDGAVGYVAAAHGIELLEKPASLDRSAGDVHIYGNPHIKTSPINITMVASNIATGLCKVDPGGCDGYKANLVDFNDRSRDVCTVIDWWRCSASIPSMLWPEAVAWCRSSRRRALLDEIGGWLGDAMPIRGQKLVCYHKNWIYFTTLFGLYVVGYVETKPGIPPTARHVAELVERIDDENVRVLLAANYFEQRKPELIAERTGIVPVVVPMSVGGEPGVETYFDLVDLWVGRLKTAFAETE